MVLSGNIVMVFLVIARLNTRNFEEIARKATNQAIFAKIRNCFVFKDLEHLANCLHSINRAKRYIL